MIRKYLDVVFFMEHSLERSFLDFEGKMQSLRTRVIYFCLTIVMISGLCQSVNGSDTADATNPTLFQESGISPDGTQAAIDSSSLLSKGYALFQTYDIDTLKARLEKIGLIHIFAKGGPIMWPLLLASILALGTVIDRLFFLFSQRLTRDRKALLRFLEAIQRGDIERAMSIGIHSKYYVIRTLVYALSQKEKSLSSALLYAQEQELKRFRQGIPILDTVITLAPLLGLLGTVTGMMGSFALIGGELSAPGAVTGGIAEALIATAFGLGIAITSLIPFNFLNTKMENARLEIESAATQLQLSLHPSVPPKPVVRPILVEQSLVEQSEKPEEYAELVGCRE